MNDYRDYNSDTPINESNPYGSKPDSTPLWNESNPSASLDSPVPEVKPYTAPETSSVYHEMIQIEQPVVKETYYSENVKSKRKPGGTLKKVIAASLIVSLVGAPLFGLSIGAGKSVVDNLFFSSTPQPSNNAIQSNETSVEQDSLLSFDNGSFSVTQVNSGNFTSYVDVIKAVEPSVVSISTTYVPNYGSYRFFYSDAEIPGAGSGIIFHEDNDKVYIVTNYHVVSGASTCYISLNDSDQIPASYVGGDDQADLAVISVTKSDLLAEGISSVALAVFGDSDQVQVGEMSIAIGNALGNGKTATSGMISALSKNLVIDGTSYEFIQTDAAINPGNSGGALINTNGEVIGINTAKVSQSSVEGIGFAIPINYAKGIIEDIVNFGSRPYLGIVGATVTDLIVEAYGLPVSSGVFIDNISSGGGAESAKLQKGDVITQIDGVPIITIEDLQELVQQKKIGDTLQVRIVRRGEVFDVPVTLLDISAGF